MFSELEIATATLVLKLANLKRVPLKVALVEHSEQLSKQAWRKLAIERLEQAAQAKQLKETIYLRS